MRKLTLHPLREALVILVGVPIVGILFGGIYSWPAMMMTKERDPALTTVLAAGLAATIGSIGWVMETPIPLLICVFGASLMLLGLARWAYGSLGHNLERFGMVHATVLVGTWGVSLAARLH